MEKSNWLLCLRGGRVLKEVGWDLQKQLCVSLYDNAERAFLDAQLDREVLNGVVIERKDPAAFSKISKISNRSSFDPDLTQLIFLQSFTVYSTCMMFPSLVPALALA